MNSLGMPIQVLRRELRASQRDRITLSKLNAVITSGINRSDGEEREVLLRFRSEITDALERAAGLQLGATVARKPGNTAHKEHP